MEFGILIANLIKYLTVAFTKFVIYSITLHNATVENFFIPYFPYPLALYRNPKRITYVDSDNGLRIDNKIRLKYLVNHDNNIEKILSYVSKMDKRICIIFKANDGKFMLNMMNIDDTMEVLSGKEYEFNTLKLYSKEANILFR